MPQSIIDVKKYLVYFLLVTYLFSFTEMKQALKLPNLIEHYINHKVKDPKTTLFSFLKMHYLDAPVKDADYKDDMKLPFKTHDLSFVSINLNLPPKEIEFTVITRKIIQKKNNLFVYSEHFTVPQYSSVFRPPISI